MPSIEIEVWCRCGNGLCNQTDLTNDGSGFIVTPCDHCIDAARDEGYESGKSDGYDEAIKEAEHETV